MERYTVFVTLCTYKRQELFGEYYPVRINSAGEMAEDTLQEMCAREEGIFLDKGCVMPDHLHAIIKYVPALGPAPKFLLSFLPSYRSVTTCRYAHGVRSKSWRVFDRKVWDKQYFALTVSTPRGLKFVEQYVKNNPYKKK